MNHSKIKTDAQRCRATLAEIESTTWATPLERIGLADSLTTSARWLLATTVDAARNDGATWAEIAEVLGVTKQAAQQRYG